MTLMGIFITLCALNCHPCKTLLDIGKRDTEESEILPKLAANYRVLSCGCWEITVPGLLLDAVVISSGNDLRIYY